MPVDSSLSNCEAVIVRPLSEDLKLDPRFIAEELVDILLMTKQSILNNQSNAFQNSQNMHQSNGVYFILNSIDSIDSIHQACYIPLELN